MTLLNVGQPIGGIIQIAYTVPDIEKAVRSYAQDLKLGPWFLRGPLQARKPVYRGNPQKLELSIAIAYSGHVMIELIQQHDEQPSVYRELIDRQGYGFHHWGIASDRFDDDLRGYAERGFELVFTDETPVENPRCLFGREARLARVHRAYRNQRCLRAALRKNVCRRTFVGWCGSHPESLIK